MEKVVCFMPIRLNSQRIKNKSIVNILNRPMFCWSLQTLDRLNIPVYLYTNDDDILRDKIDFEYKNVSFLKRPSYLDDHDTKGIDIYKEFSKDVVSSAYLLAHCTSPFVRLETYKKCIDSVLYDNNTSSMTVKKEQTFSWYKNKPLNFSIPRQRTQELNPIYIETSAAYCFKREIICNNSRTCQSPSMILTSGIETIDIDEESDIDFLKLGAAS